MDDLLTITRSIGEITELAKAGNVKVAGQLSAIETNSAAMGARILDLEQKVLTRGVGGITTSGGAMNLGALVAGDAKLAALRTGGSEKVTIPLNQSLRMITRSILGNAGSTGATPAYEFGGLPEMVPGGPRGFQGRRLQVLNALNVIPVSTAESAVPRLTSWTDSSAVQVHEGDLKGESLLTFDNNIMRHATIATFANVSRQLLADSPMLGEFINQILLYFVARKLENAVVAGNGTTDGIAGLLTQGTAFVSTAPHAADMVGDSITALMALGYSPDLVILSPFDWFAMISARDANGRYIGAGWAAPTPNSLWGIHCVPSAALANGTGLVVDSSQVALLDRQEAQILVGFVGNQFTSNAATILAELRAQLAVYDTHAISVLTLPATP